MGPGPDPQSVFLVKLAGEDLRPVLYDAAADRSWILGEAGMRLLHGNGDTVVYLQIAEDGTFEQLITHNGIFRKLYSIATSTSTRQIKIDEAGFA